MKINMPGLFNPESVFQAGQDITELVGCRGYKPAFSIADSKC
ncbi:hypothetical protein [Mucilaginibacter metallidurans]|nr:hypothetical protein [Mucilaginibacter gossypii]